MSRAGSQREAAANAFAGHDDPGLRETREQLGRVVDGHALHLGQIAHAGIAHARGSVGEVEQAMQAILDAGADERHAITTRGIGVGSVAQVGDKVTRRAARCIRSFFHTKFARACKNDQMPRPPIPYSPPDTLIGTL